MVIMGIDYDDAHQSSYKAVTVHMPDDTEVRFDSGDPTADMRSALRHLRPWLERGGRVLGRSSMDHFVMDGESWQYRPDPVLAAEGIEAETLQRAG